MPMPAPPMGGRAVLVARHGRHQKVIPQRSFRAAVFAGRVHHHPDLARKKRIATVILLGQTVDRSHAMLMLQLKPPAQNLNHWDSHDY